jgi:hypothetical protein
MGHSVESVAVGRTAHHHKQKPLLLGCKVVDEGGGEKSEGVTPDPKPRR